MSTGEAAPTRSDASERVGAGSVVSEYSTFAADWSARERLASDRDRSQSCLRPGALDESDSSRAASGDPGQIHPDRGWLRSL